MHSSLYRYAAIIGMQAMLRSCIYWQLETSVQAVMYVISEKRQNVQGWKTDGKLNAKYLVAWQLIKHFCECTVLLRIKLMHVVL